MKTKVQIIPTVHRSLADLIGEIDKAANSTSLGSIASTTFGDLEKSLNQSRFRLAVLGPWNSGKSSLINRVIGEDNPENGLLPVMDQPTTAKLTYLRYGEFPQLEKIDEYGGDPEQIAKGDADVRRIMKEEAVKKERSSLMVYLPLDFCRSGGELVDTPGLFDPDEERSLVTLDALEQFHAVIFVVPAQMPANTEILQFIEEHFVKRTHTKFFFLINKIDWLKGQKYSVDEYLDICHKELTDHLGKRYAKLNLKGEDIPDVKHLLKRERFFGVSSKYGDGIEQTSIAIRQFLSEGSQELIHVATLKTEEVLSSLELAISDQERARQLEQGKLDQPYDQLAILENDYLKQMTETEKSLPKDFDKEVGRTGEKIRQMMRDLRDEGTAKLDYSFWQQITKPGQIRQEIAALQRELVEKAEDEIHKLQLALQKEITNILNKYHENFIEPTTRDLKRIADTVDETLSAVEHRTTGKIGKNPVIRGSDMADGQKDGNTLHTAGAGVLGAGAGAAIAFGTGAAFTTTTAVVGTTTTLVSTAASWVPMWAAQTLGMTTTVSTPVLATTSVLSAGSLALLIAGPAVASAIACLAILNKIKSSRSIKDCKELLDDLPQKHTDAVLENLSGEINLMARGCLEGMKSYVDGIISRLRDYIDNLRVASTQQEAPVEITDLAKRIGSWRERLANIKKESEAL